MSLNRFFDSHFYPARYQLVPSNAYRGILSNVLSEGFRELQELERELGEFQPVINSDPSKGYSYRCSVSGYRPEELKVDVEDNELVIQGRHESSGNGQTLNRSFIRRFTLPQDTDVKAIQCNLNEKAELEVIVPKIQSAIETKKTHIPIGFKESSNEEIESKKPKKDEAPKK